MNSAVGALKLGGSSEAKNWKDFLLYIMFFYYTYAPSDMITTRAVGRTKAKQSGYENFFYGFPPHKLSFYKILLRQSVASFVLYFAALSIFFSKIVST